MPSTKERPLSMRAFARESIGIVEGETYDRKMVERFYWNYRVKFADEQRGGKLPPLTTTRAIIKQGERRALQANLIDDPAKQLEARMRNQRDVFQALTKDKGVLETFGISKDEPFPYMDVTRERDESLRDPKTKRFPKGTPSRVTKVEINNENVMLLATFFPRYKQFLVREPNEAVSSVAALSGTNANGLLKRDLPASRTQRQPSTSMDMMGGRVLSGIPSRQGPQGNGLALPSAQPTPLNGAAARGGLPSAQPAVTAQQFQEGQTATNPTTGQRMVFQNGRWVEVPGAQP